MPLYEMNVIVQTLTIEADNIEQAEEKYGAFFDGSDCPCGESIRECSCVDESEEVTHTTEELPPVSCGACGQLYDTHAETHFIECDENPDNQTNDDNAKAENHFTAPRPSFAEFLNSINPLTVGDLRKALDGLDDSTQVLIGCPLSPVEEWANSDWWNVSHKIDTPQNSEMSALTFYMVDNYDSRQF